MYLNQWTYTATKHVLLGYILSAHSIAQIFSKC